MTAATQRGARRMGGWGFTGESLTPPAAMVSWLDAHLERGTPQPAFDPASAAALPEPRPEASLPGFSFDRLDRLAHARGQGLPDLVRLRTGTVRAAPDAVARPGTAREVADCLAVCARAGLRVVPWGGGTSVTGGLNLVPGSPPTVALDLRRLAGLFDLDPKSWLATLGAGCAGPALEELLGGQGFTLGHFPQSFELSTLGGWIATRACGQESLAVGGSEQWVAGVRVATPRGGLEVAARPAAASGPELLQCVLGSEGRLGVITEATVRIRPRPAAREVKAWLVPSWERGLAAARELAQSAAPLALLRLSDGPETEVAMASGIAAHRALGWVLPRYLRLRGVAGWGCMLFLGAVGDAARIAGVWEEVAPTLRRHGAVALGAAPGRRWLADRFRHPYLRDGLLDLGWAVETLETSATWRQLPAIAEAVRTALAMPTLCHVSHTYRDGASLYFTFFLRCAASADATIAEWARRKRAATAALLAAGGTLSHHHGVGAWHAPWYRQAVGDVGTAAVAAMAASLDPDGMLNPQALLDPTDRLEI